MIQTPALWTHTKPALFMIRAISTTNSHEFIEWCEEYNQRNAYPVTPYVRFGIGLYQLTGIVWQGREPLNYAESLFAAAVHFTLTADALDLRIEAGWGDHSSNLEAWCHITADWKQVLWRCASAQQMLYYSTMAAKKGLQRASRYKPEKLQHHLSFLALDLIKAVPPQYREPGLFAATDIMTRKL